MAISHGQFFGVTWDELQLKHVEVRNPELP